MRWEHLSMSPLPHNWNSIFSCFMIKTLFFHHPELANFWSSSSSSFFHFCWWLDRGFNWTSSMKVMAARMIFHLLSMPNRQVYAHMLIYIELSVSPLHNGVKIFLMRDDEGIVTFSCNNKAKNIFFRTFFLLTPLYYLPLTEFNSIFFLPSSQ